MINDEILLNIDRQSYIVEWWKKSDKIRLQYGFFALKRLEASQVSLSLSVSISILYINHTYIYIKVYWKRWIHISLFHQSRDEGPACINISYGWDQFRKKKREIGIFTHSCVWGDRVWGFSQMINPMEIWRETTLPCLAISLCNWFVLDVYLRQEIKGTGKAQNTIQDKHEAKVWQKTTRKEPEQQNNRKQITKTKHQNHPKEKVTYSISIQSNLFIYIYMYICKKKS